MTAWRKFVGMNQREQDFRIQYEEMKLRLTNMEENESKHLMTEDYEDNVRDILAK
jgi:hypothetical protein